ncbi:MAG: hypothetical protein GZ094_05780 [Mariniphaga sp.]|nr:hypothetical protein [Mariniphaga sp.]
MGKKVVFISLLLLFSISYCSGQGKGKSIWILFDKKDSLSFKGGTKAWSFREKSIDYEPFRFVRKKSSILPDTIICRPLRISLITRKELFSIPFKETDQMIIVNKLEKKIKMNFNWFNDIYNSIYIVEPKDSCYLVYKVKYEYCIE